MENYNEVRIKQLRNAISLNRGNIHDIVGCLIQELDHKGLNIIKEHLCKAKLKR